MHICAVFVQGFNRSHMHRLEFAGYHERKNLKEMMQSDAKSVAEYLEEAPEERKGKLAQIREACLTAGFMEGMEYGMPTFRIGEGDVEVGFASQKNYISLYILKQDVLDQYRERLKQPGVTMGKGCVRFSKPDKIDVALVREMLEASKESDGDIC